MLLYKGVCLPEFLGNLKSEPLDAIPGINAPCMSDIVVNSSGSQPPEITEPQQTKWERAQTRRPKLLVWLQKKWGSWLKEEFLRGVVIKRGLPPPRLELGSLV